MARSHEFKYIRKALRTCVYDFVAPEIEFCPSGFRQSRAMSEFYPARRCTEELYDLHSDPAEMRNVADEPSRAEALAEMRSALDEHLEETDDPFLNLRNDLQPPEDGYAGAGPPGGRAH
jgi:arylsulfatase A-like enzyme